MPANTANQHDGLVSYCCKPWFNTRQLLQLLPHRIVHCLPLALSANKPEAREQSQGEVNLSTHHLPVVRTCGLIITVNAAL
jgi:hypothetical protein